jgi:hypothetical protein
METQTPRPYNTLEEARASLIFEISYRMELQRRMYQVRDEQGKTAQDGNTIQQRLQSMERRVPWEDLRQIVLSAFGETIPEFKDIFTERDKNLKIAEQAMIEKLKARAV